MKKNHAILAVLLLAALGASAQNTIDRQGRKQGHWLKTDKNGARLWEGDFKDGMETGTFVYYYPNGNVRMRNVFEREGYCSHEAFDDQGHLLAKGFYSQHNRDGEWQFFNEQGRLVKKAGYRMGVKHGVHVVFTSTGDTAEVSTWKDNRRDGRWWKLIGNKSYIAANYVDGNLEGRLVEYDEEGRLAREGFYKNGEREGAYKYYEQGELVVEELWADGRLADRKLMLKVPETRMLSVFDIAAMVPKGLNKTVVVLMDGSRLEAVQPADDLYRRLGNEVLSVANKKSRVMVNPRCVKGTKTDSEGRTILDVEPLLGFDIFPDEDCLKMLQSKENNGKSMEELMDSGR